MNRTYMRMTASTFVMKEDEIAELREDRNRRAKAKAAEAAPSNVCKR